MNIYAIMFYLLGAVIVAATALAITRRNVMHAIVYLVLSFIGTALLFYLLGAPFLAVLEVVIYAGAIMVLFLFIVMMLEIKPDDRSPGDLSAAVVLPLLLGVTSLLVIVLVDCSWSRARACLCPWPRPRPWPSAGFSSRNTGLGWKSPLFCCSWPWWGRSTWAGATGPRGAEAWLPSFLTATC